MTIKTAENMPSLIDREIETFQNKVNDTLCLYMGQMECGLRLLMEGLEQLPQTGESRYQALEKNILKDELIRFDTETVDYILTIKHIAQTTNQGLVGFVQAYGRVQLTGYFSSISYLEKTCSVLASFEFEFLAKAFSPIPYLLIGESVL
ncbi:hypothetical protein [Zymomonas mobilis]|uniref:hypothetical protein n=1 Tax=Zymomonas mobilis TaxID=542 RepID=UPI001171FFAD|nr:hypothetical protein [Zymomonas mobilis]MDX5949578.1 hypothetical protein [Zymomonas mobilis subsp. pomaceae]GEB90133.1 hypothetical protein ZMO02_17700 [Zymomonas mobilis subsp. pomaceae]